MLDVFLIIGLLLLSFAVFMMSRSHKKRIKEIEDYQKANESRERKLFNLYQNLEESMEVFEEYVTKVREDIDKEKREIIELTNHIMRRHFTAPSLNMRDLRGGDINPPEDVKRFAGLPDIDPSAPRADARYAKETPRAHALSAEAVKLASAVQSAHAPAAGDAITAAQNAIDAAQAGAVAPQAAAQAYAAHAAPSPSQDADIVPSRSVQMPEMPAAFRPMTPIRGQTGGSDIISIRAAVQDIKGKPQRVRYMLERGLTVDQIAKELDIGKGEVKLIAGLKLDD